MSHAFKKDLKKSLKFFMDDLCVHFAERKKHISHMRLVFEKCRLSCICLNMLKCKFMNRQGKIFGHIVSQYGILTDAYKIFVIVNLLRPINP